VTEGRQREGLLAGVRVLDLSTFSPVRFGTTVLADLGADVVQVDRPVSAFRQDIPLLTSTEHPRWLWHSRNKRSLGLDLRQPGARDVLIRLVEDVDVVIEGFAVGVATKLGLDYGSLATVKPDLVYASVTGFGQTGPNADVPGHEMNYQAVGGVTAAMTDANAGTPAILPFPLSDSVSSLYAVIAVLAALQRRVRTGRGSCLDISIQDSVLSLLGYPAQYLWQDGVESSADIDEFGASPTSAPYATSDGKAVVIGAVEPWVWARFCAYVDRPELVSAADDPESREHVRGQLREIFAGRSRDEWVAANAEHQLALTAVLTLPDLLADPHIDHRGMIAEVAHPTLGSVKQMATPINVDGSVPAMDWFEVPGAHTVELLRELGISDQARHDLTTSGAVFAAEVPDTLPPESRRS
jgi:alpha-methylacyl-CoA racemase